MGHTFLVDYGLAKTSGSPFYKKTSDRFEVQSLLGKRLSKLWSYSAFFGFKTAFSNGYDYNTDAKGDEIRTKKSAFLSPAYLQLGLGLSWKEHDNLWMNISPVSPRYTLVNTFFTEKCVFFRVSKHGKNTPFYRKKCFFRVSKHRKNTLFYRKMCFFFFISV